MEDTAAPYANPVIFLFMGGFMIGLAIEKWNLHRRIALNIIRITGTSGDRIVLGFILASGLLSMWLSNTATTMMMFPIAVSVIHVMRENNKGDGNIANFSLTIMLAIAYASNFGGIATIIGTPPNVAYVGYIEKKYSYQCGFSQLDADLYSARHFIIDQFVLGNGKMVVSQPYQIRFCHEAIDKG